MNRYVAILSRGQITIHLPDTTGNCSTLCGLDGDDPHPMVDQIEIKVPNGVKVNCKDCYAIFQVASKYIESDFSLEE